VNGSWPWEEAFWPKVEDVRQAIADTAKKEMAA
jgi:hypothetical protein